MFRSGELGVNSKNFKSERSFVSKTGIVCEGTLSSMKGRVITCFITDGSGPSNYPEPINFMFSESTQKFKKSGAFCCELVRFPTGLQHLQEETTKAPCIFGESNNPQLKVNLTFCNAFNEKKLY